MDARTLTQVMPGLSLDLAHKYAGPFTRALELAGATTQRRAAMFIAQVGHESASLRYMREIADGSAYEGRRDLGNVYPGDGRKFRGRGIIQVTGRANTLAFSRWAHARGLVASPDALVRDPTPMERLPLSMLTAAWYWTSARPQLNRLSDAGELEGATRAINGGLNGLQDRRSRYRRAMNMNLLGSGGGGRKEEEVLLPYRRDQVRQDTIYNCGPASTQTAGERCITTWRLWDSLVVVRLAACGSPIVGSPRTATGCRLISLLRVSRLRDTRTQRNPQWNLQLGRKETRWISIRLTGSRGRWT